MAQQTLFPKKDQAVVTDAIEGLTVKDYTLAIGRIVQPANVLFVSRISNGRICVYLSSQELVDKLTEPGTKINIDPHTLTLRPLISKAKRIIISNVCPIIPHYVIEDKIKALNITPVSRITCIRASINEPEYAHVMSFRRQVYINPEDIINLPDNMKIEYDNTTYWIYFSSEKATCFLCREEGHLAKHCPIQDINKDPRTDTFNSNQPDQNHNNVNINTMETEPSTSHASNSPPITGHSTGLKRTHSLLCSSAPSTLQDEQTNVEFSSNPIEGGTLIKVQEKRTRKTVKKPCFQDTIDVQLAPAKNFFLVNANNYPLDFEKLASFLRESYGSPNIPEVALKYATDTSSLINMLRDAYPHLADRKLKARITKIIKRLGTLDTTNDLTSNDEQEFNSSESLHSLK